MFYLFEIIFGLMFIIYDFVLIFLNPGTFLDNLTSFKHIWLVPGTFFIFAGVFRKKKGESFLKKIKRNVKIIAGSFLAIGIIISVINLCFIFNPKVTDLEESCDYVILLGGGIDKNGKLPYTVQKRVDLAAEYLKKHPQAKCVVTGGTLKWLPYAEAPEIKRQLVACGIEPDFIYVEDQALDTIQNFELSCALLSEKENLTLAEIKNSKIMIISSNFHLRRAERIARRLGFNNFTALGSRIPAINVPHCYVREIAAYVKLNARILLTGKPSDKIEKQE